jgi:hypothetical protein
VRFSVFQLAGPTGSGEIRPVMFLIESAAIAESQRLKSAIF